MNNTVETKKSSADEIAEKPMAGENISQYFTNKGKMKPAVCQVNVDFTADTIEELDNLAENLNISRQAVIKSLLRQSLDRHYLARKAAAALK